MTIGSHIESTIHLPVSIDVRPSVLGVVAPVLIADLTGTIATPGLPPDVSEQAASHHLVRPHGAAPAQRVEPDGTWGDVRKLPSLISSLYAVQIWFPLRPDELAIDSAEEATERIRSQLTFWLDRLMAAIEVLSRQNLDTASFSVLRPDVPVFELIAGNSPRVRLDSRVVTRTSTMASEDTALTATQWRSATEYASHSRDPRLEHLLLRDARHALRREEFRRTVIDVGTAVELALSARIKDQLSADLAPAAVRHVLAQSRTLGRRVALGRSVGLQLPETLETAVVEARNRAAHSGADPSRDEALAALRAGTAVVDYCVPDAFS